MGDWAANIAGHAVVGCAAAVASGGTSSDCGRSALAAGFSAGVTSSFRLNFEQGLIACMVVGGTASALSAGKFSNGAIAGAYGYMFNYMSYVHASVTYKAARLAGLNWIQSLNLAIKVVNVDFLSNPDGWPSNRESQDVAHAYMHNMCAAGVSPDVCAARIERYERDMRDIESQGGLAGLLHLDQDRFAGQHAGMPIYDGHTRTGHKTADMFLNAPPGMREYIVNTSANTIKLYTINCECF